MWPKWGRLGTFWCLWPMCSVLLAFVDIICLRIFCRKPTKPSVNEQQHLPPSNYTKPDMAPFFFYFIARKVKICSNLGSFCDQQIWRKTQRLLVLSENIWVFTVAIRASVCLHPLSSLLSSCLTLYSTYWALHIHFFIFIVIYEDSLEATHSCSPI